MMISSELPEVLAMTDRVLVLHEGALAATLVTRATSQEEILHYAAGLGGPAGRPWDARGAAPHKEPT